MHGEKGSYSKPSVAPRIHFRNPSLARTNSLLAREPCRHLEKKLRRKSGASLLIFLLPHHHISSDVISQRNPLAEVANSKSSLYLITLSQRHLHFAHSTSLHIRNIKAS